MIPKGDGKWLLRWFIGRNNAGKRQYASETFEGTTYQAQRKLSSLTNEVEEGTHVIPSKQTVQQYLEWWLEHVCKPEVAGSTLASYTARLKNGVFDTVGALKLHKLTWQQVQTVYNGMRDREMSGRTIQYTHTVLKQALSHAVKGKLLKDNPCDHAIPGSNEKKEMLVWTAKEVQLFLERTQGTPDYPLWHTLLNTGLRPGEAFGLKWGDLQGDRLHVVRSVVETDKKGKYTIGPPKTDKSKRSVALTGESLAVLQAHRKAQAVEILAIGPDYDRKDFIFAPEMGGHDLPTYTGRRWRRAVRRVNAKLEKEAASGGGNNRMSEDVSAKLLKDMTLYGTRHTHFTMLLKAGVHPKVVADRAGHASVVITLDTYSHVSPDMQDEAVGKLTALMQANGK
jgi:integrase